MITIHIANNVAKKLKDAKLLLEAFESKHYTDSQLIAYLTKHYLEN